MLQPRALAALDDGDPLNAAVLCLWPLRWTGTARNPGGKGFFCVIDAQGFQPGKPLLIGGPTGDVLPTSNLVSFLLQSAEEIFQVCTGGK